MSPAPEVKVYPFHQDYPGMPSLFHASCSECGEDWGVCDEEAAVRDSAKAHEQWHATPGGDS